METCFNCFRFASEDTDRKWRESDTIRYTVILQDCSLWRLIHEWLLLCSLNTLTTDDSSFFPPERIAMTSVRWRKMSRWKRWQCSSFLRTHYKLHKADVTSLLLQPQSLLHTHKMLLSHCGSRPCGVTQTLLTAASFSRAANSFCSFMLDTH